MLYRIPSCNVSLYHSPVSRILASRPGNECDVSFLVPGILCVQHAGLTVTFHHMKTGLLSEKAKEYTGIIKVADIGICADAEQYVGPGDLMMLHRRESGEHKGDSGKILVIGGGPYSGAPALASLSALKAGADLVTVAVPEPVAEIVASYSPNLIVRKLSSNVLCPEDLSILMDPINSHEYRRSYEEINCTSEREF